jgi:hypothetical protein
MIKNSTEKQTSKSDIENIELEKIELTTYEVLEDEVNYKNELRDSLLHCFVLGYN